MITESNQEATVTPEVTESEVETTEDTISISRKEYDTLNQSLGSLKRELKDLRKQSSTPKEELQNRPDESILVQKIEKMALKSAGITHPDDIELAQKTAKKWGVDIDEVLSDEDFVAKLDRQRTARSNADATSNIRGDKSRSQAKDSADYWIAKGTPPTADQVPDRRERAKIVRSMLTASKSKPKFYNE